MLQIEADSLAHCGGTQFRIITMDAKKVYVAIRTRFGYNVKMRMWSVDFVLSGLRRLQQELTWKIIGSGQRRAISWLLRPYTLRLGIKYGR
jgi:hypothetical protein